MITKNDMVKFASAVKAEKSPEARFKWANIIADVLSDSNPRFDRKRFMNACDANHPLKQ